MRLIPVRSAAIAVLGLAATVAVCLGYQDTRPVPTPPPFGGDSTLTFAGMGGMASPVLPSEGFWGEVIMADSRWLVVQNNDGQQFPVSYELVRQYYVRWPATIEGAAPNALAEVTGVDIGSNQLRTDHVDVYEGSSRSLVSPTFLRLAGYNRVYSAIDVTQESNYGIYFPMTPNEYLIPRRLHIVGPIMNQIPLQLAIEGNNLATVVPAPTGMTVTQVTVGTPSVARKGDLVYVIPEAAQPKSLQVAQLVLYKNMPYRAFVP